jgi:hypothetical protein
MGVAESVLDYSGEGGIFVAWLHLVMIDVLRKWAEREASLLSEDFGLGYKEKSLDGTAGIWSGKLERAAESCTMSTTTVTAHPQPLHMAPD